MGSLHLLGEKLQGCEGSSVPLQGLAVVLTGEVHRCTQFAISYERTRIKRVWSVHFPINPVETNRAVQMLKLLMIYRMILLDTQSPGPGTRQSCKSESRSVWWEAGSDSGIHIFRATLSRLGLYVRRWFLRQEEIWEKCLYHLAGEL